MRNIAVVRHKVQVSVSLLLPQMKIIAQHLGLIKIYDVLIFVAAGMAS